jgi:hypothetical protein
MPTVALREKLSENELIPRLVSFGDEVLIPGSGGFSMGSNNGPERWRKAFRSVDWVIPAYIPTGRLSSVAALIERAGGPDKERVLKAELPLLYDEERLSSMLLGLYCQTKHVKDFKVQISEAIEAFCFGLTHAAIATLIPILEGIIRRIAKEGRRDVGSGTTKLIDELNQLIGREDRSPNRYEERLIMLEALRDFFSERLLKTTTTYAGLDQLNRHGILHGIFEQYGEPANFFRLITLLDLLCFTMALIRGGSCFAPARTPESMQLAEYYRKLKLQSFQAVSIRAL